MIDINLSEMIAAAQPSIEDESERVAFENIPGPPIKGLSDKAEPALEDRERPSPRKAPPE